NFRLISLNSTGAYLSKVERSAVLGQLLTDAFPGAAAMGVLDALRRVHRSGVGETLPDAFYKDNDVSGWFRNELSLLPSSNIMAMYVDVTADVTARKELEGSETRYQLLTESMADGIYDWDIASGKMYFSPAWKAQLGYADDELENALETWDGLLHPDQRDSIFLELTNFIDSDIALWDAEFQLQHKAGHYIWIHSRGTPVRDPKTHRALRLLGVHINIDREKAQEQEVALQRNALDGLMLAMPDLVFLVDAETRILYQQAGEPHDLYQQDHDFSGERMSEILPKEVGRPIAAAVTKAVSSDEVVTIEYSLVVDGALQDFESRISPTRDGRAAIIARNITSRKVAEKNLNERIKELRGLYEIYRYAQSVTDTDYFAQSVAKQTASAMQCPDEVRVKVSIDDGVWEYGRGNGKGLALRKPLSTANANRGALEITFSDSAPPLEEEEAFLDGAATAVSLWLENSQSLREAKMLERMLASTDNQVAILDAQLRYVLVNPAYAERFKAKPKDLIGRTAAEVLGEEGARKQLDTKLSKALDGSTVRFQEWRDGPKDQTYMDIIYAPYSDANDLRGVAVSIRDVTPLYEAESQLRRAARVFSSSAEAIMMTTVDGTITDVNEAFTQITGYEREEALGQTPHLLSSHLHDAEFFSNVFQAVEREDRWQGELWNKHRDGKIFPCLMTISGVKNLDGELDGYVGVLADISAMKDNEHRLEVLAHQDTLTGLPNRAQLIKTMDRRIDRSSPDCNPFTVMFVDLDHFKNVNDTLGHSAGDNLLREASQRLLHVLREQDVLARIGGDEFIVILPGIQSRQNASIIATKIIDAMAVPFTIRSNRVLVTASIGICSFPEDGRNTEALLRNADTAMYKAKAAGRSTWCGYSQEMTNDARRYMSLSGALREAIAANELELVYQPKFDLHSLELSGFEALSRWEHSDFGAITPTEFIMIAESSGLIIELDNMVLRSVCAQLKHWLDDGLEPPRIAVNVSGWSLQQPNFFETVSGIIQDYGLAGDRLELELTETALIPKPEQQSGVLDSLRKLGVSIAIDDFGTGYSSLAYLQKLPVTQLKIDASFVRDIAVSSDAAAIAETIIAMARALDFGIIAEGVETEEQADFLREHGPMEVQGFLYGRGLKPDDAAKIIKG
ncbi:EAL domain-containing protein, partial [Congregibacter sp.]|uniref:sensor domain-containing protein n=1 Tax=Congregibacter sp. TaxID=2744308 RepID=UPI0038583089